MHEAHERYEIKNTFYRHSQPEVLDGMSHEAPKAHTITALSIRAISKP
jgi:hypothetical protein